MTRDRGRNRARRGKQARSAPSSAPTAAGSSSSSRIASSAAWIVRMRLALGEQPAQGREMRDAVDGMRRGEKTCRAQIDSFDRIVAEMIVEPRPPSGAQRIPRLQPARRREPLPPRTRPRWRPRSRVINSRMTLRLAVALDAEHDAFIDPLHGDVCTTAHSGASPTGHGPKWPARCQAPRGTRNP